MEALFMNPVLGLEKTATAGKVGDASELWPQEVLDLFYEQHPDLSEAEVTPVFRHMNDERGYAVGVLVARRKPSVTPKNVDAEDVTKEIRFPFVIRNKDVSPFDVFIVGESFHPATPQNVQTALFRPELFDITRSMPGDVSLVNQLYPPYRSRFGLGTGFESGSGGKFASADLTKISVLDQILPFSSQEDFHRLLKALSSDEQLRKVALANGAMFTSLQKLSRIEAADVKEIAEARRQAIEPDVIQITKVGRNKIAFKYANSGFWAPYSAVLTMKEAAAVLPPELKSRIMTAGGATISTDPVVRESFEDKKAIQIKHSGIYEISKISEGSGPVDSGADDAVVFTSVVDFDMTSMPVFLAVFFDGTWCLQDDIAGKPCASHQLPEFIVKGHARVEDYGAARSTGSIGGSKREYDSLPRDVAMPKLGTVSFVGNGVATMPVTIKSVRMGDKEVVLHATTAFGQRLDLIPTDGIKKIEKLSNGKYALPANLKVIQLGRAVRCAQRPEQYVKVGSASLEIISDGAVYTFRRHPSLSKLGEDQTSFLDKDAAMFLAAGFGLSSEFAGQMLKKAARIGLARIDGVRPIITEAERIGNTLRADILPLAEKLSSMRTLMLKEAAVLPTEDTIDKVLSLNFITPENVSIFTKNIPVFQSTTSELAKLLIAVRMGLENVPESAVQRAMQSLQNVIESLQEVRFNQPKR